MNKMQTLSKNQQIIFDLIDKSPEPMKAYAILFNVQKRYQSSITSLSSAR